MGKKWRARKMAGGKGWTERRGLWWLGRGLGSMEENHADGGCHRRSSGELDPMAWRRGGRWPTSVVGTASSAWPAARGKMMGMRAINRRCGGRRSRHKLVAWWGARSSRAADGRRAWIEGMVSGTGGGARRRRHGRCKGGLCRWLGWAPASVLHGRVEERGVAGGWEEHGLANGSGRFLVVFPVTGDGGGRRKGRRRAWPALQPATCTGTGEETMHGGGEVSGMSVHSPVLWTDGP